MTANERCEIKIPKTIKNSFPLQAAMVAILLAFALCVSCACRAQTISPVSSRFTGGGKGDLTLTNNSLEPMNVSVEAVNFEVGTDRKVVRAGLDPHTHVKFSRSGIRIGPKDSVHVFFDASADTYPAWFMIYATFMSANPHSGIKNALMLGHPVYMYQKESIPQGDITLKKVTFDPATHMLRVFIENHGDKLARPVMSFPQLRDNQYRLTLYPVFPRKTTTTYFDLSKLDVLKDVVPKTVVVEFDRFKLTEPVTVVSDSSEDSSVSIHPTVPGAPVASTTPAVPAAPAKP